MPTNYTMRLLKCPACGGPIDPPAGESTVKCPYCGNAVVIPESLRTPAAQPQQESIFSGMNMGAMMGYGAQWGEIAQLARAGNKAEAINKYKKLSGQGDANAEAVVDSLSGSQMYEFTPGSGYNSVQIAPIMSAYADTAKTWTRFSMWLTCGIVGFVFLIIAVTMIPVFVSVFGALFAVFNH